jgi:hypothetical protein
MALLSVTDREDGLQIWMVPAGQPTRGDTPGCWLDEGLTTPHHNISACYEMLYGTSAGCSKHGNEPLGSIKGGELLD